MGKDETREDKLEKVLRDMIYASDFVRALEIGRDSKVTYYVTDLLPLSMAHEEARKLLNEWE